MIESPVGIAGVCLGVAGVGLMAREWLTGMRQAKDEAEILSHSSYKASLEHQRALFVEKRDRIRVESDALIAQMKKAKRQTEIDAIGRQMDVLGEQVNKASDEIERLYSEIDKYDRKYSQTANFRTPTDVISTYTRKRRKLFYLGLSATLFGAALQAISIMYKV